MNFIGYLKAKGYNVVVFANDNGYGKDIRELADIYEDYKISRTSVNIFKEFSTYRELAKKMKSHNPDIVISFTIKPNLYSNLIFRNSKTKVINVVTGRGRVFGEDKLLRRKLIGALSKFSYDKCDKVVLNNPADFNYKIDNGYIDKEKACIIYGEGVDLEKFKPAKEKNFDKIRFLFIGRFMMSKGIEDFIYAALKAKESVENIEIQLAGSISEEDPDSMKQETLDQLVSEGKVTFFGYQKDPMPLFEQTNCVVLPTYYNEGMPKSLMEAAAMYTPIICSDLDACRQVVDDCVTGFLCKPKDRHQLSEKLIEFAKMSKEEKLKMGVMAREKAIKEFDVEDINEQYHNIMLELINKK